MVDERIDEKMANRTKIRDSYCPDNKKLKELAEIHGDPRSD